MSMIGGVLLAGRFRGWRDLRGMPDEDRRNTLIVELANRTNRPVPHYQALDDYRLAGAGAAYVFLRHAEIRSEAGLRAMSDEDLRNTLIVELAARLGEEVPRLQGLGTMDLVRLGLGVEPSQVFRPLPPPLQPLPTAYVFSIESLEVENQKSDSDHSDSDWLHFTVTVGNPATKNSQTFEMDPIHMGDVIHSGDVLRGAFATRPFEVGPGELVIINYAVTNMGSSDAEEQFAQAVKVSNKIVDAVAPVAGAAIGFFAGDPAGGVEVGQQIARAFDTVVSTLGDVFDFLGVHVGPPNCNGEVLHDTLTYLPQELGPALGRLSTREYTGPQENSRCGAAPKSKLHFMLREVPV